jgi:hypothetical protein
MLEIFVDGPALFGCCMRKRIIARALDLSLLVVRFFGKKDLIKNIASLITLCCVLFFVKKICLMFYTEKFSIIKVLLH